MNPVSDSVVAIDRQAGRKLVQAFEECLSEGLSPDISTPRPPLFFTQVRAQRCQTRPRLVRLPPCREKSPMSGRYFDHLYAEICVSAGRRVSRYGLWLAIWEAGTDPDELSRKHILRLVEGGSEGLLARFMGDEGCPLSDSEHGRLTKTLLRFDPRYPTPEEWTQGLMQQHAQ